MKKKSGSALVTVLAVSIFALTIGGTLMTTIIKTTKSNQNSKEVEDLAYAAESGIEVARSYFTTPEGADGEIDTTNNLQDNKLIEMLKVGIVKDVKVTSKEDPNDSNKIIVTSEAIHKNNSTKKLMQCKLKKIENKTKGIENIFDYGLVAGQGDLNVGINGSSHIESDVMASGTVSIPTGSNGKIESNSDKISELKFLNAEFKQQIKLKKKLNSSDEGWTKDLRYAFYDEGDANIDITNMSMNLNSNDVKLNGNLILLDNLQKVENKMNSVIDLEITGAGPSKINILFVNTDNLTIELQGNTVRPVSTIVINKGHLIHEDTGVLELIRSTLYSKSIKISEKGSIKISGESGDPLVPDTNTGHCIKRENYDRLNIIIGKFIDGWGGTSSGESTEEGGFELDDNAYS